MSTGTVPSHLHQRKNKSEQSSLTGPVVGFGPLHGSCPNLGNIPGNQPLQFPNPNPNPNPPDVEANDAPLINQPQPPPRRSFFARFFAPKLSRDFEGEGGFKTYTTASTRTNDFWWKFFKICFVIGMGGFFLSLLLGISYIFAAQWKSPRPSFVFRNPTANKMIPIFIGMYIFLYIIFVFKNFKTDHFLFFIRKACIGFLSMDLIPLPRFLKAAIVTIYGLLDLPEMLGDWSDLFFVWSVVFYCLASISMLKLFEHEHHEASSVLLEFSLNLVSPFIVQFFRAFFKTSYHLAYLNFSMFFIVMVLALFAKFGLKFIYRPHVAGNPYSPPPPPDLVGPPM